MSSVSFGIGFAPALMTRPVRFGVTGTTAADDECIPEKMLETLRERLAVGSFVRTQPRRGSIGLVGRTISVLLESELGATFDSQTGRLKSLGWDGTEDAAIRLVLNTFQDALEGKDGWSHQSKPSAR